MNKQKYTDALTALETSTQLHKDAIGYSQRAIEQNQLAVKLLIEAIEENEKETIQVNGKYTFLDDSGLHVFGTADTYRKHIVELAKEEISGFANRQTTVAFKHKEEDIEKREVNGFKTTTYATIDEKFIVNKEKRTVVCLLVGHKSKHIYAKGIAKCDPNDTFNEHFGKVIAFYRAAGEEVPVIFTNVPNPENIKDGDIVKHSAGEIYEITNIREEGERITSNFLNLKTDNPCPNITYTSPLETMFEVIDDSNRK